jgi:hypothetical protein
MSSGDVERLTATILLDRHDPTRLTYQDIKSSWGSCTNFFNSYGLKFWDQNDCEEALQISRAIKAGDEEEEVVVEQAVQPVYQQTSGYSTGNNNYYQQQQQPSYTNTNTNNSQFNTNRPVCRFYLQGNCRYGTACRFYHPAS